MEVYLEYSRDHRGTLSERRNGLYSVSWNLKETILALFQTVVAIREKGFLVHFYSIGTGHGLGFLEYYWIIFRD
jgi:hypothetical protein